MNKIKEYLLQKDKSFQEGVKLLLENDKNLKASHRSFLEAEADKEEPSKIAKQLLESKLRKLLRIAAQKQNSKTKKKAIVTEQSDEPTEPTKPEEPDLPTGPNNSKEEQSKNRKNKKQK